MSAGEACLLARHYEVHVGESFGARIVHLAERVQGRFSDEPPNDKGQVSTRARLLTAEAALSAHAGSCKCQYRSLIWRILNT